MSADKRKVQPDGVDEGGWSEERSDHDHELKDKHMAIGKLATSVRGCGTFRARMVYGNDDRWRTCMIGKPSSIAS